MSKLITSVGSHFKPHAALVFHSRGVHVVNWRTRELGSLIEPYVCSILECFVYHHDLDRAYDAYSSAQTILSDESSRQSLPRKIDAVPASRSTAMVLIGDRILACSPSRLPAAYTLAIAPKDRQANECDDVVELHRGSRALPIITVALMTRFGRGIPVSAPLTRQEFNKTVSDLFSEGLLTLPPGEVEFGDLRRGLPLCPLFGMSRGTPIDRYYLEQFISEIRQEVTGTTLEIGGAKDNARHYGFTKCSDYKVMDLDTSRSADIVADAHSREACLPDSFDSVVIFNVLEHCERPWVVLENIRIWLRSGGKVFCMVPNAQRVHPHPKDYWRFLPHALALLFAEFQIVKLVVYGSLLTSIASLAGIAAEELATEELSRSDNDYPVASCVVARRR
jgi:SAM-dependent methyltransferase